MKFKNLSDFIMRERQLGKIIRFNAITRIKDESVAEHSFHTTFYALLLANIEKNHFKNNIDIEKTLKMALMHDLEEVITGDIIYNFKYSDPSLTKAIKNVQVKSFEELIKNLPEPILNEIKIAWEDAKKDSIESKIVRAADKLEALAYVMEEIMLGNKNFIPVKRNLIEIIEKIDLPSAKLLLDVSEKNE